MKFALKLAAGCAILIAAPASAQILGGGGGAGGSLGGSLGGAGGNIGGNLGGSGGLNGGLGGVNGGLSGRLGADTGLSGPSGRFDVSRSVALNASTAASVEPGTIVTDASGRAIGTVQTVRASARGAIDNVVVRVGNRMASLPVANFGVSGDVLVSGMTRAELVRASRQQQAAAPSPSRARSGRTARGVDEQ
ncbi:MAG TPA: hypothetical protein VIT38_00600 [Allosphingosinicella sp.]